MIFLCALANAARDDEGTRIIFASFPHHSDLGVLYLKEVEKYRSRFDGCCCDPVASAKFLRTTMSTIAMGFGLW
jgi:hypothetical protein